MATMINDCILSGTNRVGIIDQEKGYLILTQFELDAVARLVQGSKFDITIVEMDKEILKLRNCVFCKMERSMIPKYEMFAELFNYEYSTEHRCRCD